MTGDYFEEGLDRLKEAMEEPLHPDLVPFMVRTSVGPMLRHPLVISVFPIPGYVNRQYLRKVSMLKEATDYRERVWLHERPWRFDSALTVCTMKLVPFEQQPQFLLEIWSDAEPPDGWRNPVVQEFIGLLKPHGFVSDDHDYPDAPTGPLVVYRGGTRYGVAWSTSLKTAEFFAKRFHPDNPKPIWKGTVPPDAVIARIYERDENEVILNPYRLRNAEKAVACG